MSTATVTCTITLLALSCKRSIPPQAQIIARRIAAECKAVEGKCDRATIVNSLTPEDLHTKQSVARIVAYYLPLLKECGLISYDSQRGSSFEITL